MKTIILLVNLIFLCGCAPKMQTYADCILKHVDKRSSNHAAALIHRACEQKYAK